MRATLLSVLAVAALIFITEAARTQAEYKPTIVIPTFDPLNVMGKVNNVAETSPATSLLQAKTTKKLEAGTTKQFLQADTTKQLLLPTSQSPRHKGRHNKNKPYRLRRPHNKPRKPHQEGKSQDKSSEEDFPFGPLLNITLLSKGIRGQKLGSKVLPTLPPHGTFPPSSLKAKLRLRLRRQTGKKFPPPPPPAGSFPPPPKGPHPPHPFGFHFLDPTESVPPPPEGSPPPFPPPFGPPPRGPPGQPPNGPQFPYGGPPPGKRSDESVEIDNSSDSNESQDDSRENGGDAGSQAFTYKHKLNNGKIVRELALINPNVSIVIIATDPLLNKSNLIPATVAIGFSESGSVLAISPQNTSLWFVTFKFQHKTYKEFAKLINEHSVRRTTTIAQFDGSSVAYSPSETADFCHNFPGVVEECERAVLIPITYRAEDNPDPSLHPQNALRFEFLKYLFIISVPENPNGPVA